METPSSTTTAGPGRDLKRSSRKRTILTILGVLLLGCGLAAGAGAWWVKHHFYAGAMQPVQLSAGEQQVLDAKLKALETPAPAAAPRQPTAEEANRTLLISQKEINAYLANQGLGDQVRVELDQNRIMTTMIVPIPEDSGLPLVSGTTLRVRLTLDAMMDVSKKLSLKLSDVRVGGISLPNAWLGDIKGVNVAENVEQDPAVQRFLAGIQEVEVRPEGLRVLLAD